MAGGSELVKGRLWSAASGRVTGWAWSPGIDERVLVGVFVDGELVARERAMLYRAALRRAGIGDGAHAFAIELPPRLCDGARHRVGAVALLDGAPIPAHADFRGRSRAGDEWFQTEFAADPEVAAAAAVLSGEGDARDHPLGWLEMVEDGRAHGWAYDPREPGRRSRLELVVDGEPVAETVADLFRPSLFDEGIGDGHHGFIVSLPERLCDGARHRIAVRRVGGPELPAILPLSVSASAGGAWEGTAFVSGEHADTESSPNGAVSIEQAEMTVSATGGGGLRRLRASVELMLPRRLPRQGFSDAEHAETVVLGGPMRVEVEDQLCFAIQPGVQDPLAERRMRFGASPSYSTPPLVASRLPRGIVDTRTFVIMPDEHSYVAESVRHRATLSRWGYRLPERGDVEREIDEIAERDERVVVLGAQSNVNYSHWLVESVARALLFEPLDDGSWSFLTPLLGDWQRETLALAGVPAERLLELKPGGLTRFREVVSVSRGMGGLPALRPTSMAALAALAPSGRRARRRIYCSRANARYRHVVDEPQLEDLLARHGFEPVCPETLTVAAQIELFASAEAVFALHGSGLTNILFSGPGTLVIELQAEQFNRGGVVWNWILASLREQPFAQIVCPLADDGRELAHAHRDVSVDIAHLDGVLSRLLAP